MIFGTGSGQDSADSAKAMHLRIQVKEKKMAKKIMGVLLSVILLSMAACKTTGTPQVDYSKIVDAPGVSQDDLFVKVNLWAVGYFNKADSVIEYSDKGAGIISGKYIGHTHLIMGGLSGRQYVRSIFTISVKDDKVKLDLKPTELITYNGNGQYFDYYYTIYVKEADIIADYNATLESLKQALTNSSNW
jgi:hypothetical protein